MRVYTGNRVSGTVNEQYFEAVSIDFDSRKINCTRIGVGENREFNY